ncbi:hypothetical protein AOQ84DRAFT_35896 [Glonium stellatum]|uniref:Uncharacterized protein n=1 Tax=Glonium stellatum TaxID=574774 RepID=A0A8E2F1E8_9PEZI|nr:hypothetical protein AOQ84DRAFT_35896 [Glonium stellatum]
MLVAIEAELDKPRKKTKADTAQAKNGKGKAKPRAPRGKGAKGRKGKNVSKAEEAGKKGRGKAKGPQGPSLTDVGSLFTSNVFRDAAGHENGLDQPTFDKTTKADALKQLIASVPEEFQKTARKDKAALLAATRDFSGQGSVKADGKGGWLVKGMKSSLNHYQLLGSAFMRRREGAAQEPRGGLSADQMGLGKTVMMLANMINGRPRKGKQPRTTLIVASPALLTQWEREIKAHCEEMAAGNIMRYDNNAKIKSNRDLDVLQGHDIVLTTYSEVMRSYPKNDPPIECQTPKEKQEWWKEEYEKNKGLLHRMIFYRVVLDEAQTIKNHLGRTSIACRGLMAKHRWALSGTPILNTLTELYPYFKFLRVPHTGSFRIFKSNYCSTGDPDKSARLLIQLNQFMIRRTHKDVMFGGPILKLPKATPITHWCEFNEIERIIYDIVRRRFVEKINMYAQARQLDKCYYHVFVMLLRLRQLTGHILMLQLTMENLLEREDIERLQEVTNEASASSDSEQGRQIISIRKQLAALVKKQKEAPEDDTEHRRSQSEPFSEAGPSSAGPSTGGTYPKNVEPGPGIVDAGGAHGMTYDFSQYLKTMKEGKKWEEIKERAQCGKCRENPKIPWATSCHHIYCRECLENLQLEAAERERDAASCLVCGNTFTFCQKCDEDPENPESQDLDGPQNGSSNVAKKKGKKGQRVRPEKETISNDWIELNGSVLPSAKTLAIKAQILNWMAEDPNVKIIVYTQFLAMIRILVKICGQEDWSYCEYHGNMSFGSRDRSISEFTDDPQKSILLASLRCGGLGLNLMMASRVIIIDPWWNHAVEQQAFCRVFRYGQQQKTYMTRFCVKNTVDEKLIQMQEKKQAEIDDVMEDDGTRLKKLTLKELMRLFGPIREEEDGTPFILVDDPIDDSGYAAGLDG